MNTILLIVVTFLWLVTLLVLIIKSKQCKTNVRYALDRRETERKVNNELVHITAHDLQEPLRKIQAFGDRIKSVNWQTLDEKSKDYLIYIINAASHMQELIDELLKFSKVANKVIEPTAVDLNLVVKEVLEDFKDKVKNEKATIVVEKLPVIIGDAWELRQLFRFLLENAFKFRHPQRDPAIKIYDNSQGKQTVCIEDNGIGFDNKYADRIFQIFQRLHHKEMYEGTGMGLAICRKIMEQHGGKISARGVPDQGATFIITFPDPTP